MTLETIKLPKDVIGEIRQFIVPHPLAFVLKDGLSWIINMKTIKNELTYNEFLSIQWGSSCDYYYLRSPIKNVINKKEHKDLKLFYILNKVLENSKL
tara:strand:- start:105 stop:395 length:291 start_codon:yes stop_codon:yes gene_type:complete